MSVNNSVGLKRSESADSQLQENTKILPALSASTHQPFILAQTLCLWAVLLYAQISYNLKNYHFLLISIYPGWPQTHGLPDSGSWMVRFYFWHCKKSHTPKSLPCILYLSVLCKTQTNHMLVLTEYGQKLWPPRYCPSFTCFREALLVCLTSEWAGIAASSHTGRQKTSSFAHLETWETHGILQPWAMSCPSPRFQMPFEVLDSQLCLMLVLSLLLGADTMMDLQLGWTWPSPPPCHPNYDLCYTYLVCSQVPHSWCRSPSGYCRS